MKTLTVAELRYLLAQLPPELDDKPVISSTKAMLESGEYIGARVTCGDNVLILNLD
jgi:hypothetical protein